MIYGQQSGEQAGSVWSIAMATAMGNGIVPRSTEEPAATRVASRIATRWPWARTRTAGEAGVVAHRA